MPRTSKAAFGPLEPGFRRCTDNSGKPAIKCEACAETLPLHQYQAHLKMNRHARAISPSVPLLIPRKRARSPSPPFAPPDLDFGQEDEDVGGFDAGDNYTYEEDSPVLSPRLQKAFRAPILHHSLEERPLADSMTDDPLLPGEEMIEEACRELEKKLGVSDGGDSSSVSAAAMNELATAASELFKVGTGTGDFKPFENAAEFCLFALCHVPSAPLSTIQIRLQCLLLKSMNTPDIPSYSKYLKLAASFQNLSNEPPLTECQGGGYPFYHKSIPAAFERDLNNPRLAEKITAYPRRYSGWKDLCDGTVLGEETHDSLLTPMIRISHNNSYQDLYVEEPVTLSSGSFFLPTKWFVVGEEMWCEGSPLRPDGVKLAEEDEIHEIPVNSFDLSQAAKSRLDRFLLVDREGIVKLKRNPLRNVAGGKRLLSLPVSLHADDFSPSTTASNTQYAIQFTNAGLPRAQRFEPASVRVWAATKDVEPLDLLGALRDHLIEGFNKPIFVFHAHLKEMVALRVYPLCSLGDTAMNDRYCSHMGSAALKNCRVCKVGFNSKKEKQTAEGFASYLEIHVIRQAEETIATLRKQIDYAEQDKSTKMKELQTATGIKDKITTEICTNLLELNDKVKGKVPGSRKLTKAKQAQEVKSLRAGFEQTDWYNPLLDLCRAPFFFNIHERTPQDMLHIYNIGPLEFLTSYTSEALSIEAKDQLQVRLEAFNTTGLKSAKTLPAAALIKNMGSLVGRERTWLAQAMAVCLAPLVEAGFVEQELQTAWRCMGEYGRECYMEEVAEPDKERYLANMKNGLGQVIESYAKIDPSKITSAFKFHGCLHLNDEVKRYSVPLSTSCERHEAENGRLKIDSNHSNHSAPSKDIATREVSQEWLSHILDGGFYKDSGGQWVRAGREIRHLASSRVLFRRVFGLGDTAKPYTVAPTLASSRGEDKIDLSSFAFSRFTYDPDDASLAGQQFSEVTTRNEVFVTGTYALIALESNELDEYGFEQRNGEQEKESNVVKILSFFSGGREGPEVLSKPFVVAQLLSDCGVLAKHYDMKSYKLEEEVGIFPLSALVCQLSVVHDCVFGKCVVNEAGKTIRSERQDTQFSKPSLDCSKTTRYVLNDTLYRSAHLVGELYGPIPPARSFEDIGKEIYDGDGS